MSYATRFAPSPSGHLHIGHAYSALIGHDRAAAAGGRFLVRIEDIDRTRSKPEFERAIFEDLAWLGLSWPKPVLRQSDRLPAYRAALDRLVARGLCYPCRCRRADIRAALAAPQEGVAVYGPDGPVYPGTCRGRPMSEAGPDDAIRLDMRRAVAVLDRSLDFVESGPLHAGTHRPEPEHLVTGVGDVVLARRDMGTSYHMAVTVDDAHQGITDVVRGADLFKATEIHVLLQVLLELPRPTYYHHDLIRDETGRRLAKRDDARTLRTYRAEGATPGDIRALLGLTSPVA